MSALASTVVFNSSNFALLAKPVIFTASSDLVVPVPSALSNVTDPSVATLYVPFFTCNSAVLSNLLVVKLVTSVAFAFFANSVVNVSLLTLSAKASFTLPAVTNLLASPVAFTLDAKFGVTLTLPSVPVDTEIASPLPLVMEFTSLLEAIVTELPAAVNVIFLPATNFTLLASVSPSVVLGTRSVVVAPFTTDTVLIDALRNAFNCFTLMASLSFVPLATLVIRRRILPPLPTETTPLPVLLTASFVRYPFVALPSASAVVDPSPSATE